MVIVQKKLTITTSHHDGIVVKHSRIPILIALAVYPAIGYVFLFNNILIINGLTI